MSGAGPRSKSEVKADPSVAELVWDRRTLGEMELASALGGAGPLLRSPQPIAVEVAVGEGAQLSGVGDVVADLAPTWFGAGVVVEMGFEPVSSGAPNGPTRRGPGRWTEELN